MPKKSATTPETDSCLRFADCIGLQKAASDGKNFVFSPLSIRCALSLAAAGSNGSTLDQFLSFLGSRTLDDLNSATEKLMASVKTATGPNPKPNEDGEYGSHVSLANSLWFHQALTLKPAFKEIAASVYGAEARPVDFHPSKVRESAKEINAWAESQTNGLIKQILPLNDLHDGTMVVLVNALYFKGKWLYEFDTEDTEDKEFHLLNGTSKQVPFMHIACGSYQYIAQFTGFKVLKLRYKPNEAWREFSMLIFLPNEIDGLKDLIQKAVSDPNFFNHYCPTNLVKVRKFRIPKFKISCAFKPSDVLPELGLDLPFDGHCADLTETVFTPYPSFKLVISRVFHKATIEVGEKETEASAATLVSEDDLGCCLYDEVEEPPTIDFVADLPFMFAITEDRCGTVLFLGHVVDPSVDETEIK
ncbi:uncharacterized protein A4U43_C08F12670 [Asparagus officinalis]|uniref:serpin-ZX-like n=1 Tax=Asparagus officinalis TaxID=4686 RepID=UPI00098E3628|nr:serpin-ZX-like [Asparagus officinalis]ONK59955.1 uncharacterized protein A4U43_C08F12670 [Asparagus officinalis]